MLNVSVHVMPFALCFMVANEQVVNDLKNDSNENEAFNWICDADSEY